MMKMRIIMVVQVIRQDPEVHIIKTITLLIKMRVERTRFTLRTTLQNKITQTKPLHPNESGKKINTIPSKERKQRNVAMRGKTKPMIRIVQSGNCRILEKTQLESTQNEGKMIFQIQKDSL